MPQPDQALLKRRQGTDNEAFRDSYLRHGHLVLPWCLDNSVVYYAQVHKPQWRSSEAAEKYPHIDLSEWDAAAEMLFDGSPKFEGKYYEAVILPDERRFLFSEAKEHLQVVDAGSVVGERIEFIVDGKPIVDFEEWRERWQECEKRR